MGFVGGVTERRKEGRSRPFLRVCGFRKRIWNCLLSALPHGGLDLLLRMAEFFGHDALQVQVFCFLLDTVIQLFRCCPLFLSGVMPACENVRQPQ